MRRIFSNPIVALAFGAFLRMFFVLQFPAGSGDTPIYEQLATNWLKFGKYAMDVSGQPVAVDLRMPGYPAFLALLYALTGRVGEHARMAVMVSQALVDLAACVVIAGLAAVLALLCNARADYKRGFTAGLWLAALCPFTANYVAVPLTEVWAVLFGAAALLAMVLLATTAERELPVVRVGSRTAGYWRMAAAGGFVVGAGTLFRPEAPLLLATTAALMAYWMSRRGEAKKFVLTTVVMIGACALPLVPWATRNAVTLHEFQPLAPKDATLPGEVDPRGFMAWERTWLYRFRDCYLVSWKLNQEAINLEDIPTGAFDTPGEKERVEEVLRQYNDDLSWTAEEDAVFAQLARVRTARHPLRTYLWIPLRRAVRIWFTPRIELLPVSGNVFPLAKMWDEDPADQQVTLWFFALNVLYVGLGVWGGWKLWKYQGAQAAVLVMALYILVRTAFLTTLETPEPRYVLVCFPALIAMGAQVFAGSTGKQQSNMAGSVSPRANPETS